jgi:hypothetical protein
LKAVKPALAKACARILHSSFFILRSAFTPRWLHESPRVAGRVGRDLPERFSRRAPLNQCQPRAARQRLGVRWVRGEGTHRFPFDPPGAFQSGVSPVPAPPSAVLLRRTGSHRTPKPRGNSDGSAAGARRGRFMAGEQALKEQETNLVPSLMQPSRSGSPRPRN